MWPNGSVFLYKFRDYLLSSSFQTTPVYFTPQTTIMRDWPLDPLFPSAITVLDGAPRFISGTAALSISASMSPPPSSSVRISIQLPGRATWVSGNFTSSTAGPPSSGTLPTEPAKTAFFTWNNTLANDVVAVDFTLSVNENVDGDICNSPEPGFLVKYEVLDDSTMTYKVYEVLMISFIFHLSFFFFVMMI